MVDSSNVLEEVRQQFSNAPEYLFSDNGGDAYYAWKRVLHRYYQDRLIFEAWLKDPYVFLVLGELYPSDKKNGRKPNAQELQKVKAGMEAELEMLADLAAVLETRLSELPVDLYETLELEPGATEDEIIEACGSLRGRWLHAIAQYTQTVEDLEDKGQKFEWDWVDKFWCVKMQKLHLKHVNLASKQVAIKIWSGEPLGQEKRPRRRWFNFGR